MRSFIGYSSLEEWAEDADRNESVYAVLANDPSQPDKIGMRIETINIICSQLDERGNAHYFRRRVGLLQYIGDKSFGPDHKERIEWARQAWEIVREWLEEAGFRVRSGTIAPPSSLKLMEGEIGFLDWDEQAKRFIRARES